MMADGRSLWLLKRLGTALAVLLLLLLATLFFVGSNTHLLREPIARTVSARLKRPVSIERIESLDLFSLHPHGVFSGVTIGNPAWASRDYFVKVGRVSIELSAMPWLLRGVLVLPHVEAESVDIHLLRDGSDRANWRINSFDGRDLPDRPVTLPMIGSLDVRQAHLELDDQVRMIKAAGVASADRSSTPNWIRIQGTGATLGRPFAITAIGQPAETMRTRHRYVLTTNIFYTGTRVRGSIRFNVPFELETVELDLEANGPNLADLYYLTHLTLPNTRDYRVKTRLVRDQDTYRLTDIAGQAGASDLEGTITVSDRSLLTMNLSSRLFSISDVFPPEPGGQDRLFPNTELRPESLRKIESDVSYHADTVQTRKLALGNLGLKLHTRKGVMTVDPVSFQLAGGRVSATVKIDATHDNPDVSVDARAADISLAQFHPKNTPPPVEGMLFGRAVLHGRGRSPHEIIATSDGTVTAVMPHGEIRKAFAELVGAGTAQGLGLLLTKDQGKADVRCGVAQFRSLKGTLVSQSLVFDTADVLISGKGEIDLGTEIWDLSLSGASKKPRLFSVRSPVTVEGPLLHPQFGIKAGNSIGQGGVALGLAALVGPLAAILPFVDPGLAKNANCSALLEDARQTGQEAAHNR